MIVLLSLVVCKWRVIERRSLLVVVVIVVGMIAIIIIMSMTVGIRTSSLEGGRDIIRATITMLIVMIVIIVILIIIVAVVTVVAVITVIAIITVIAVVTIVCVIRVISIISIIPIIAIVAIVCIISSAVAAIVNSFPSLQSLLRIRLHIQFQWKLEEVAQFLVHLSFYDVLESFEMDDKGRG